MIRRALTLALVAWLLAPLSWVASAQSAAQRTEPGPVDPSVPRLLVSGIRSPAFRLGIQAAREVRDALESTLPRERWWVIAQRDIEVVLDQSYPADTTVGETDIRQVANIIRASAVLEVSATDSAGVIALEAALLFPRRAAAARPIARVEAPDVRTAARRLAERIVSDSLLAWTP